MIYVLGDLHIPHHDPSCVQRILRDCRKEKPKHIVLLGDVVDFYCVRTYLKNPAQMLTLKQEIDVCQQFLQRLRQAAPDSYIYYCQGNHEIRLQKFLWECAPQLTTLDLDIPSLLDLKHYGIHYEQAISGVNIGTYWFTHGCYARRNPGHSVLEYLQRTARNTVIGHCHRLAVVTYSIGNKLLIGGEAGCLTKPDYHDYVKISDPNWGLGYLVIPDARIPRIEIRGM